MSKQKENKILPKGWTTATIGELISQEGVFVDGDWIESKDQDQNGDVRLIQLADIGDGDFRDKSARFLTLKRANEINCTFLKAGDVLVARMPDPIGRACTFPLQGENKFVTAVDVAIIRVGLNGINSKFLMYAINSPKIRNEIDSLQGGTTRKRISRGNLGTIKFFIPPKEEQDRIVLKIDELLSDLEKAKEQIENAFEQIKIYRQSLLNHAFHGKLSEHWRKYNKKMKTTTDLIKEINASRKQAYEKEVIKFQLTKRKTEPKFPELLEGISKKESKDFPELPKEWSWFKLGDISSAVERVNSTERKFSKEFLYLDIGGIDNVKNKIANHKVYEWGNAPSRAQQIVNVGDILFSTVRTYMKNIAYVDNPKYNYQIASTGFTVIRPENGFINSKYIFNYILSETFLRPLNELQTGSSYPAVRDKDVFNQPIPICSTEEQNFIQSELEKRFSICSNLEETISTSIKQCEVLKQTILQKAFEGKLVDQNPNDESAVILLKKIKREREIYLLEEKNRKQDLPRTLKTTDMAEQLKTILELIQKSKRPISPLTLWQASEHKDDIDAFYAKLKEHIDKGEITELPRKGKEIFLTATPTK